MLIGVIIESFNGFVERQNGSARQLLEAVLLECEYPIH
jgi:hypothetical protein